MVTKLDATQYNLPSLTKTLYVDKRRTDVYVEDGALNTPFKTIMGAINKVIANGDNYQTIPYTIRIATGVYAENVILEDTHLVSLIIIGEGSRLQTQINPSSGYSLQSMANNANFYDLHMENIQFTKPTMMVGSANNNYFGYNFFFVNCYWPDTALATFKNMTYPSFMGDICKFSGGVVFSNITQASINGIGGFKTSSGLTIETDQTANKPYLMTTGTAVLACQCRTPNVTWSLLNITTMTGTALQIRAVRHGISGETIPINAQILAYHSSLIGNYVNNGTLTLYNSQVSGTLSGTAPVLYQFASQIKNDSTVIGITVKDAINTLVASNRLVTLGTGGTYTDLPTAASALQSLGGGIIQLVSDVTWTPTGDVNLNGIEIRGSSGGSYYRITQFGNGGSLVGNRIWFKGVLLVPDSAATGMIKPTSSNCYLYFDNSTYSISTRNLIDANGQTLYIYCTNINAISVNNGSANVHVYLFGMSTCKTNGATGVAMSCDASSSYTGTAPLTVTLLDIASVVKNVPAGTIVATDVQSAINELDTKKTAKNLISGTFITSDVPPKTVTITNGQVTSIV